MLNTDTEMAVLPGQWWERLGMVLYLHPNDDPNCQGMMTGWIRVTSDRAREVLEQNASRHPSW